MNAEQVAEVWEALDREHLEQVVRKGPPPVFATVSGAHLYGFPSPDSDVDLRGAFLLTAREMLGLQPPRETLSFCDTGTVEVDWVAHDLRKFARLMTQHNGYVLEQLYSPLVVTSTPAHEELLELGRGCATRPTVRHYQGFARSRRRRLGEPEATVKHLLYAYRVLLTGIHLMRTGEVVANVIALNQHFGLELVDELVARKQVGGERMLLEGADLALHGPVLDRLEAELAQAHDRSSLPEEPTTAAALEELVIRVRLEAEGR